MPFGLNNAPASFQNLVNDIFHDLLDIYAVVYLDDIIVFSKSEEEHVTHVSTVLSRIRANSLFGKASKFLCHVTSLEYLGYVVASEGLKMDQSKVQKILNWTPPRNLKALQSFLVFANFYHHLIKNYSKKISSLTRFLKKDSRFPLNEEALRQFHQLKEAFTIAPILLYQPLCIVTLGQCLPREGGRFHQQESNELSKNNQASKFFAVKVEAFSNLIELIQKALWQDSQYRSILQDFGKGKYVQYHSLDSSSQLLLFKDRVVVPNDPTIQLSILQKRHDSPLAGHPGQEKTLKLVKQDFHWPGMTQFIKDYVSSCQQCSRNKNINTRMYRFSKMAVFIPTISSLTSMDLAHLFIKNVFSKHGLPSSIVSDTGSLFVSSFWTNLCQKLKISRDLSTAYHPETEGQTERLKQILEQYLWMY
ncbi:hypothetical protein O181_111765, partial [Austropuccinia psidii MF-1]|nr:hypothetical protein [Austropuccinia psidii MF-1]